MGMKVVDLYADGAGAAARVRGVVDEAYVDELAAATGGRLGGQVGVAPRIFIKKLVGEVLDRVDQFPDFDPQHDYALTVRTDELTDAERAAMGAVAPRPAAGVDDTDLALDE
ncbi:BREX system ATP-binding domain-containing protein [Aestuariimicrobium soli]|uniref:BREX system ATP-binding domain-containing protein n=1 Tax=Aestuariimicrobium soli TaxID=2035834 RepID=UPI003EBDBF7D